MNHYPFNPSDYMMATAHLEPLSDLCYRRCIDLYMDQEGPFVANAKQTLSKRLRVNEDVLGEVLAEFFLEDDGMLHHKRCDEEIAHYRAKRAGAKKAGSLGGMAKKQALIANAKQTLSKRLAFATNQNQNQNQEENATHSKAKKVRTEISDDEWMAQLKVTPEYQGIPIESEYAKACEWCSKNHTTLSRRRFANWLARAAAEKPIAIVARKPMQSVTHNAPVGGWKSCL